ncbi:hypothetical protein COV53_03885 [Candidatus Gottesmanbacteria bacterium CG11_big_fil_rev_8_21_14_0_20_37_11]|uniref:Uncharacterized protein n=3 Tax=Candidatus Gottesmaniibacteriota TaxID=1752720 RepID=A0A2M7RP83_9BACT|nr:MAG: hypothetical protein AUJ73_03330 [Candidatus Gottesmanbacteria bacterium CG1_02_37_22]PIP32236.1 MAG: hypothetical protein COX23_05805 [Candidatus Gottesmanbacteria bacterium CG23_combo_of_CG06-09_8_20_14_all_37_19]PIR08265.1 MAG: hypothetical protein COV53_03885 [Candidatus Gottesmanbacteria bacterium CG11_big_fil_rev_8_21_14_0_20_37_11]PIZ02131.1 MAG: hypothetical protein COY59_06475 [Candidatus Gottesmanbacteria bacterium CG_4_10_14_0_8_um_filter_37_24]
MSQTTTNSPDETKSDVSDTHITPNFRVSGLSNSAVNSHEEEGPRLSISKYTEALLKSWKEGASKTSTSPNKISVSQTVSFAAFLYEKMRNAVEFREEHLIRRSTIERILKRRMILNENGRDIAEPLIKELLWARYYENNTLGEEKINEVQAVIDKYFFLRNELTSGRSNKEQEKISKFILECLSCEIEENLSPNPRREAFINYVYQILHNHISHLSDGGDMERDILVYIAIEKTFTHSDLPLIKYHLLKLMLPEITKISWKDADKILPNLFDVYQRIDKAINHPFSDKIRNALKKEMPLFLILRDIFTQNSNTIESILVDENKLKFKVDEACRRRYDESRVRLRRTGIRSFIYILLTKVVFAFIIEIPYDLYIQKTISYMPIIINVAFPPLLMALIIMSVTIPGDDNTRKIFQLIKEVISTNPEHFNPLAAITIGRKIKRRGLVFRSIFSLIYLTTYLISFGAIIFVLSLLSFNPVSQGIFIFFITLVTFFTFKVIQITQEYQVVDKEGILSPLFDFFFLPIIRVGQWLSGEVLQKFNFLIFFFDFIIEMPFKAIVEVFDEWVHFIKLKKEEIV